MGCLFFGSHSLVKVKSLNTEARSHGVQKEEKNRTEKTNLKPLT